jgi:hypothetical protein
MKRRTPNYLFLLILTLLSLILKGCSKPNREPDYSKSTDYDPRISISLSSVTASSAVLHGSIANKPYYTIQNCGFWWYLKESELYTAANVNIIFSSSQVIFSDTLTGLSPNTTYFFIGYAKYTHPGSSDICRDNSWNGSFTTRP